MDGDDYDGHDEDDDDDGVAYPTPHQLFCIKYRKYKPILTVAILGMHGLPWALQKSKESPGTCLLSPGPPSAGEPPKPTGLCLGAMGMIVIASVVNYPYCCCYGCGYGVAKFTLAIACFAPDAIAAVIQAPFSVVSRSLSRASSHSPCIVAPVSFC